MHAYRDCGPQSEVTRWKPRRVSCTLRANHADEPGNLYVVKFLQGQTGAAALISEVICTSLYRLAGLATLDPVIVCASGSFAASYLGNTQIPYNIVPGDHFGTMHRSDVEAGPPPDYDDLADPSQVIRLWVFDSWVNDIDRERDGNILLTLAGSGKFDIVAADQSDCFCGAATFCSADFTGAMSKAKRAPSVSFLPTIIFHNGGPAAIREAIKEVRDSIRHIPSAVSLVPQQWWNISKIDPGRIENVLVSRARRLEDILKPDEWAIPDAEKALLL